MKDIDIVTYMDRYIKVRQIDEKDICLKDIYDMIKSIYHFPTKEEIKDFVICAKNKYPKYKHELNSHLDDIIRIYKAKEIINKNSHNPIISYYPMIIDFDKYKIKKEMTNNFFIEKGMYRVVNSLKNIVVFERVNNVSEGIRICLRKDIDDIESLVMKGDIFELMITRKLFVVYWDVVKVYNCIPKSMV